MGSDRAEVSSFLSRTELRIPQGEEADDEADEEDEERELERRELGG